MYTLTLKRFIYNKFIKTRKPCGTTKIISHLRARVIFIHLNCE